mmetsp:Transcript_14314/g.34835  ORF Transcript_14314/g.34835 Transcript_14314/m.34835 type:complete len:288 (+) Transcript_14314:1548-2411(+)
MIEVYAASSSMGTSSCVSVHFLHFPLGLSKTKSYTIMPPSGMSCVTLRAGDVIHILRLGGGSLTSSLRSMESNFLRPSSSTEAPMDQMRAKRKSESSHTITRFSFISAMRAGSWNSSSRDSYKRMSDCARLISCIGCGCLHILVATRRHGGTSQSNIPVICSLCASVMAAGSVSSHDNNTGRHPSREGCTYTMPQRDTVAGDATAKSATSKIIFMSPCMATISPLFRHNFLLSSSTVFMFSIQIASTGPSKTIHLRSGVVSLVALRNVTARIPSAHSLDTGSSAPYS